MKHPYQRRTTLGLTVLSACLLAGCTAPLLQDMNASLKSVNANLRGVNDSLRGASGTPPATVAASTSHVCDPAAFEAGFKAEYVLNWNWGIHDKETLYQVKSQQYPQDAATRHNYALYQGKQMIGKKINKEVGYGAKDYGLKIDNHWHIQNDCQARSYQEGKMAGGTAAMHDLQALEAQEV
jgi:hypothetical protein